jgi:hypothetical protein
MQAPITPTSVYRDFSVNLPCGCNNGHLCEEAHLLWDEIMRWIFNPLHPKAVIARKNWEAHFHPECTCDPDPNRQSTLCPACRALQPAEMEF